MSTAAPVADRRAPVAGTRRRGRPDASALGVLAAVAYLPLFLSHWGRLNADTKLYLYLDPSGLLEGAPRLWNDRWSGGTVTHQNIGYLWPMGPYYWVTNTLGVPDWVAQRFWLGSILFAAAAGAYWCFRTLWRDRIAALVAGLVYGLSPFVLGHITGQSALLLPFAALPWLVVAARNALRGDPWRWAAVFALVTTTAGSLNGSSIFFVLAGALMWIPYAVWWERSTPLRTGVGALVRIGVLTLATQLWWLAAYRVGGTYGLPILSVTETVRETSATTSAIEVLRGLGYWFFYGGDHRGPWLQGFAPPFTQSVALLAVSFAAPLVCLLLGWASRARERAYFVALVVVGLVVSTMAFGGADRSAAGTLFESLSRRSDLVLSLRNTQRAAALVAFGLAGLGATGLAALRSRPRALRRGAVVALVGAAVLTFVVPWRAALVPDRYERPEAVPQAWTDTAAYLDRVQGRALILPGIDFGAYRWGHTLDPVLAGLTRTEVVWHEQLPMGSAAGAGLVAALDRALQSGQLDPAAIVPVARALGITHIVVANDLEWERYRIARPETVMAAFLDPASPLRLVRAFGPGYRNRNPGAPIVDEVSARGPGPGTLPQVAVFAVPGVASDPVATYPAGAETVVHGDSEGVLAAAASGLVDDDHLPLLSGTDLRTWPAARHAARQPGARHVVTDTNRRQVRRWYTVRQNTGATQTVHDEPRSGLATDTQSGELAGSGPRSQSVAVLEGARSVDATGYGDLVRLLPEDRPVNAFDGDPRTAWRIDARTFHDLRGDAPTALRIAIGHPVRADHVDVIPLVGRGAQPVRRFEVVLDGARSFPVEVDPTTATAPGGTQVTLDGRPFSTLAVRIPDDPANTGFIGIAEVAIPGVSVEELVRMPHADGLQPSSPLRVAYVMTRLRVDPGEWDRMDPETAIRRRFSLPTASALTLGGTARLDGRAPDDVLDAVGGTSPTVHATSSGRLLGDPTSRASAALDGDPTTAWQTPLDGAVGARWTARVDGGFDRGDLSLDLVADRHHSIPTEVVLSADGVTQTVPVPAVTPSGTAGTVRTVVLTPPRRLVGTELSIEITAVTSPPATDDAGTPRARPVAIAEVGLGVASPPAPVSATCRDDLLAVDGTPVPVLLGAPTTGDPFGTRTIDTCDGAPLTLAAGAHVLRTAPGLTTGIDVDRLTLVTAGYSDAPGDRDVAAPAEVVRADRHGAIIRGGGDPYWIRLNQSANRGWQARARWAGGATDLGSAHTLDGFANGWAMTRGTDARATVVFSWTPQRTVDRALLISTLAALLCVVLCVVRPRRRWMDATTPALPRDLFGGPAPKWYASALAVLVGGLFGGVAVGIALAVLAIGAAFAPRHRRLSVAVHLAPVVAIGAAVVIVVFRQFALAAPHSLAWPTEPRLAHLLAYGAVLGVALLVSAQRSEDLAAHDESTPP